MKNPSDKPDTASNSSLSAAEQIMQAQETKDPQLAAKQDRLLKTLRERTSAAPPADSSDSTKTGSTPNAPAAPSSLPPETTAESKRAEAQRRLQVRRLSQGPMAPTRDSSK